jgi:hypothetical protein
VGNGFQSLMKLSSWSEFRENTLLCGWTADVQDCQGANECC